jgi:hypothetical protein
MHSKLRHPDLAVVLTEDSNSWKEEVKKEKYIISMKIWHLYRGKLVVDRLFNG